MAQKETNISRTTWPQLPIRKRTLVDHLFFKGETRPSGDATRNRHQNSSNLGGNAAWAIKDEASIRPNTHTTPVSRKITLRAGLTPARNTGTFYEERVHYYSMSRAIGGARRKHTLFDGEMLPRRHRDLSQMSEPLGGTENATPVSAPLTRVMPRGGARRCTGNV